jgi:cellulose synthase/poly-beta-1,6-N-acetylglucosamine synthase-like glycosyltransferase
VLIVAALLVVCALPIWIVAGYLLLLTLLSARPATPTAGFGKTRFAIVVPAHDEAQGIARTVESLLGLQWPVDQRRVVVVADNCQDETAALARAAGAEVIERQDATRRGKGYALEYAFRAILVEGWAEAIVVIDADTLASPQLLASFDARLAKGALAIQAFYGVLNPDAGWRTRLITIALAIFHRLRSRGREALKVSCGLRGNGMCFSGAVLRQVPHRAFSIVEDLEYGIQLGRAGIRVWYADESQVLGEMVSTASSARSQRQRWEGGRAQIARLYGAPLLRDAIGARSGLLLDLAFDVLVPPLGTVAVASGLLAFAGCAARGFGAIGTGLGLALIAPALVVAAHVMRGVALSGLGTRGWSTLALAPAYLLWKISLRFAPRARPDDWVRTQRERGSQDDGKGS